MILLAAKYANSTEQRFEIIAVSVVILLLIFELIRRRRLMERYAILWLLAGVTVVVLSVAQSLLVKLTHAAGISYAPSAVFAIAFLFVLAMLVQFSMTISRLSDQNTALAQRLALLQERLEGEHDDGSLRVLGRAAVSARPRIGADQAGSPEAAAVAMRCALAIAVRVIAPPGTDGKQDESTTWILPAPAGRPSVSVWPGAASCRIGAEPP